jgi:hypothetical protein
MTASIKTRPPSKEYMENWEKIFGKKKQPEPEQPPKQPDPSWFDPGQPWHEGE